MCRALFVDTNTKHKPTRNTYYFYDDSGYGPAMGQGRDLVVGQNMLDVSSNRKTYDVSASEIIGGYTASVRSLETWVVRSPYQGACANKGPSVVLVETEAGKKFSLYSPHSVANFNFDRIGDLNRDGVGLSKYCPPRRLPRLQPRPFHVQIAIITTSETNDVALVAGILDILRERYGV